MALPKDPRQKMINFMYLVLTAMLAMNVSAEILNAFDIVNDSIITSNSSLTGKNDLTYKQFEKQLAADAAKAGPYKKKADEAKKVSADAVAEIERLKEEIIKESGGRKPDGDLKGKDNLDAATRVMENRKEGNKLQKRLEETRAKFLSLVSAKHKTDLEKTLPLKIEIGHAKVGHGGPAKTWSIYHFNMVPTIAAVTILSKFQNDIKNSESLVIDGLLKEISEEDFVFDQLDALVSLNSKNLTEGQTLTAQIAMGAYSSTVTPTITVNGQSVEAVNGKGTFSIPVSGLGEKTISGTVVLTKPNGQRVEKSFSETYNVGATATAISADKMNVLYIAVQNPISITAAGVPAESVVASIEGGGGRIEKKGAGQFMATVTSPGTCKIVVSATVDGKVKTLASKEYRVKNIPDPVTMIGFSKGGLVKTAEFKQQQGVRAVLENFEFEGVKYDVVGFRIGIDARGKDYVDEVASSAYFPGPAKSALQSVKPGDKVYIENIKVKGPDGKTRDMPYGMTFTLN
ncbi:gliding motility protein GldM [uncultured Chitinophaga sp.]|uniref:type IX secretion system motor protein PorM/GldM n=1 Tax=uncultured Chitinophaga sp. TaxID=339340 RepID=UPI0025FDD57D|nr:gliding motility protein GldM [uncultured Chitinophaga sp.]